MVACLNLLSESQYCSTTTAIIKKDGRSERVGIDNTELLKSKEL